MRRSGAHTLTVFGLHTPHGLLADLDPDTARIKLAAAALHSLNSVLAEPIQDVVMPDRDGRPCVEAKTTTDLEHALGMTAGNIFHGALGWPFAEDDEDSTRRRGAGVWPPTTTPSCCAVRAPAAAARCPVSAGRTRRWPCWRVNGGLGAPPACGGERSDSGSVSAQFSQKRLQRNEFRLGQGGDGGRRGILDGIDAGDQFASGGG